MHDSEIKCVLLGILRRRFALLPRLLGNNVAGHTTRAPPVEFELATNLNSIYYPVLCHCQLGQDIPYLLVLF